MTDPHQWLMEWSKGIVAAVILIIIVVGIIGMISEREISSAKYNELKNVCVNDEELTDMYNRFLRNDGRIDRFEYDLIMNKIKVRSLIEKNKLPENKEKE